jgi:hypothetical protein
LGELSPKLCENLEIIEKGCIFAVTMNNFDDRAYETTAFDIGNDVVGSWKVMVR